MRFHCHCTAPPHTTDMQVGNKVMYLDATHFKDKQLLERLSPKPPGAEGEEEASGQHSSGSGQQHGSGSGQQQGSGGG